MKKLLKFLFISISVLILVSCNGTPAEEDIKGLTVKVSAVSKNNGNIQFNVYPENKYGMIANGASVGVIDSNNTFTSLPFNSTSQCFTDTVDSTSSEFTIKVKSALSDEIVSVTVPHKKLEEKPVVTSFSDLSGNDMLAADKINSTEDVVLAWEDMGENVTYIITVMTSAVTVFVKSTNALTIEIPAGTLSPSTMYYLKITAQRIVGDPIFETADYYSVSEYVGSSISFNTAE